MAMQRSLQMFGTLLGTLFFVRPVSELYEGRGSISDGRICPCGGGLEYLHRSPASRKRRQNGNRVPMGITGPPCTTVRPLLVSKYR
jgi:hypothetical protein